MFDIIKKTCENNLRHGYVLARSDSVETNKLTLHDSFETPKRCEVDRNEVLHTKEGI